MGNLEDVYIRIEDEKAEGEVARERRRREPEVQRSIVRSVLDEYGVEDFELQDGNNVNFTYNGLRVHLHMDKRYGEEFKLSGEMHRTPLKAEDKKYLRHAHDIIKSEAREDFQRLLDYREFTFEGHPRDTAKAVMEMARLPLEKILEGHKTE